MGEPVELRPEPGNPYDEHAIAVFSCRGIQLGYLPSERAVYIGTLIRQGRTFKAIFQGLTEKVGWARVAFDGEELSLPRQLDAVDDGTHDTGDGFWPNEIYPDE